DLIFWTAMRCSSASGCHGHLPLRSDRASAGAAPRPEEVAQQITALLLAHAGGEFDAVAQPGFAHQVVERPGGPGLGVHRADDEALDAGQDDRAGTHGAGL